MAERIEMERYTLWRFDTAANFLAALRRSNSLWLPKNDWDCLWLFRGQEREGWSLVPRVWRKSLSSHPLFIQYATDASIVSDDEANGIVHDLKLRGFGRPGTSEISSSSEAIRSGRYPSVRMDGGRTWPAHPWGRISVA